ncbi:MAG: DUF5689 domain-containing protein [Flavobacteriaceae bacterium]
MKEIIRGIMVALFVTVLLACVDDRNFDPPEFNCDATLVANTSYAEVKSLYVDQTFQIQEDLMIEGYVISSDVAGNFFSVLHFQDRPIHPTEGFQMEIDVRDAHLFYPIGSKIYIKLKGLYLGRSKDVFKIGGVFTSFGNESVGRLPAAVVDQHIFVSCEPLLSIRPTVLFLDQLSAGHTNTLVQFSDMEILEEDLGQPYATAREETERILTDCNDNEIVLLNSGFADFQAEPLPEGNGTITGVLLRENNKFQLAIRSLADIAFVNERCEDLVDEFTSINIFISELADPDNNAGARFVELYNAADEPLSLKGWRLLRYTNDNTEVSASIDLSGLSIGVQSTLVISPNAAEFERVYGFAPDLGVGTNSAADSNGDDNLVLIDPFGTVIDVFGVIGVDGSGTNHEFEDGRAVRNSGIIRGNPIYTFSEWTVYNDTGGAGTIEQVQVAPDDFNPKVRN